MKDLIDRQAAIKSIQECADVAHSNYEWDMEEGYLNSIDCIKALPSAQPVNIAKLQPNCNQIASDCASDCISRQAAVNEFKTNRERFCDNTPDSFSRLSYSDKCRVDEIDNAIAVLVNLPSAQPEIIHCKDCKYNPNPPECGNAACVLFYGMTDQMGFCHHGERRERE